VSSRTREDALLLGVAAAGAAAAIVSVREAMPPSPGLWIATAAALALTLAALFAFWFGGQARRIVGETLFGEWDAAHKLLSAIPDGLFLEHDGTVRSVNRRLCELLGFEREELLGSTAPFPFWPPEHRHELEAWHRELEARGEHDSDLTLLHRDGSRVRVHLAGRTVSGDTGERRHLVTVRDISAGHRREQRLLELASGDPETGLLNRRGFEERLGHAARRALTTGGNLTVVLAALSVDGRSGEGVFRRPEALVAVERLRALMRADDELARTRDGELAWILPDTDAHGGVGAVARARTDLAFLDGVALTVAICDLTTAGDALALYALAGRALATARDQGIGATVQYTRGQTPALAL
jgi:PAS domain S-box-containing protein